MKQLRVGLNGAGRIGRLVIRQLTEHSEHSVVAINDMMDIETLRYLLRFDSIHQQFTSTIEIDGNCLNINNQAIAFSRFSNPNEIPWEKHDIDIVIDSSGQFLTRAKLEPHLKGKVKHVVLGCPPKDETIPNIILGINENMLNRHTDIVSNASCTANGVAPMLDVMLRNFGIENAYMTTIHPFTNNQRIMDAPHPSPRRSRSLANNIIPTHSTAVDAIYTIFPSLKTKFSGNAIRVPVPSGAYIELVINTQKTVSVKAINEAFLDASLGYLRHILEYTDEELVSSDIINNPASCVFDSALTGIISEKSCHISGWYDNEFGYASRVVNLVEKLSELY